MRFSPSCLVGVMVIVAAALLPAAASAQGCYVYCVQTGCGGGWHGTGPSGGAASDVCNMGDDCSYPKECMSEEEQQEQDDALAVVLEELHRVLEGNGGFGLLVDNYVEYLVFNAEQNQVIVVGGCDNQLPLAIATLNSDQALQLETAGLLSYHEFLKTTQSSESSVVAEDPA